jgi:hypothetical protein
MDLTIADAASVLEVRPKDLLSYLREHRWVHKQGSRGNQALPVCVESGDLKPGVLVTPEGMAKLVAAFAPPAWASAH